MLARFFIDRPVLAWVISIIIVLLGAIAAGFLPVAEYPEIAPPTVRVTANYPGANAQVVADTVAAPIEQQVVGVEGMLYMSSQSNNDGSYTLDVTFELGTNANMAQESPSPSQRCPTWSGRSAWSPRSGRRTSCWGSVSIPTRRECSGSRYDPGRTTRDGTEPAIADHDRWGAVSRRPCHPLRGRSEVPLVRQRDGKLRTRSLHAGDSHFRRLKRSRTETFSTGRGFTWSYAAGPTHIHDRVDSRISLSTTSRDRSRMTPGISMTSVWLRSSGPSACGRP